MPKVRSPLSRAGLAGVVLLLNLQAMLAHADPADPEAPYYRIEAQPLAHALMEYSEQSKIVIVVPSGMLEGKTSHDVEGRLDHESALELLLKGTGLDVEQLENGALTLQRVEPDIPVPPRIPPPMEVSEPEERVPELPPAKPIYTDDAQSIQDAVIVTGIRGAPRSIIDSPTPIDVFTYQDLQQGSPIGIYESIRYLIPSFNLPTRGGGGTASIIASGGMRGLNPDHTLVLVNGKRRHKTALIHSVSSLYNGAAGVDLNMFPASAISRIEVLRDGAAAQYGSDAIAGVINIILKDDPDEGELAISAGQNFDRDDGEFFTAAFNGGTSVGSSGSLNVFYNFMSREESNRAVPISDRVNLYPLLDGGARDPREATIDRMITQNYGAFPQATHVLGGNFSYEAEGFEFYSFGTYGTRKSELNWSFRAPNRDVALPEIYPDGFRPRLTIREDDYELAAGVRGETASGWAWDVSSSFGTDLTDWENTNGLNASLGPSSPTRFHVGRLISSEWVNALDVTKLHELGHAGALQFSFGLQHRLEHYEVEEGEEASWKVGDYVRPDGQPFAGQPLAPGAQATPGFRPDDAGELDRTNLSAYGELGWTPSENLFLNAAIRYEDFDDDAGDELIYKVGGRYALTDWLALRASYNTGFRAPSLAQQTYSSTTSQFRDLDGDGETELLLLKNLPVNSIAARALGSSSLKPETSRNTSVGFALTPRSNLSVTVDAYQIDLDDRIVVTSTFSPLDTRLSADGVTTIGDQIQALLVANGLSSGISGQYYTNAIDTRTRGLDIVATYRVRTDYGDFKIIGGFNRNETDITGIVENPPELEALGDIVIFDRSKQAALTDTIPDSKISLGAGWEHGRFRTHVRTTRFGRYMVRNATNPEEDYDVDPEWIADLEIGYALSDNFTIYFGANNLLNTYPEQISEPGETNGSNMYNTFAPFGFTGGTWFVRGAFNW
jgi:iron complex outermembrane receptor protein